MVANVEVGTDMRLVISSGERFGLSWGTRLFRPLQHADSVRVNRSGEDLPVFHSDRDDCQITQVCTRSNDGVVVLIYFALRLF